MCSYFEKGLSDYIFSSSLQDRLKKETSFFVVYWIWYANGKNIYQKKITVRYEALLGGGEGGRVVGMPPVWISKPVIFA